jgi:hypothetical protein
MSARKTIVFLPSGLQTPELELILSKAQAAIDQGEELLLVTCAGGPGYACCYNLYSQRPICAVCCGRRERGVAALRGPFRLLQTPTRIKAPPIEGERLVALRTRASVRATRLDGVDTGLAAYSSYVGLARDLDLEGGLARWSLNFQLATAEEFTRFFRALLAQERPQRVVLYSGRSNIYRPLLRVAQQAGVLAEVMEFAGPVASGVYQFDDHLPQEIGPVSRRMEEHWRAAGPDRDEHARRYFELKRGGRPTNDRSYVSGQRRGLLPHDWTPGLRNVVVFNSSEDEMAAIGGEWDQTLYPDQATAIERICRSLEATAGVHVWLRIHPNLARVRWTFSRRLLQLERHHRNVSVIPGDSPVSSYDLLDAASVVLHFGSTMGFEATYWGKPSVHGARSVWEQLGSVHRPRTHEELVAMLVDPKLPALPDEGAKMVALFWTTGGHEIPHLGGTWKDGFTFRDRLFPRTRAERATYAACKVIEAGLLTTIVSRQLGPLLPRGSLFG